MKFENWLIKQQDRDDPIGDLAKDFILAQKINPFKTLKESMGIFSPCHEAYEALKDARKEFREIKCTSNTNAKN